MELSGEEGHDRSACGRPASHSHVDTTSKLDKDEEKYGTEDGTVAIDAGDVRVRCLLPECNQTSTLLTMSALALVLRVHGGLLQGAARARCPLAERREITGASPSSE